jgi:MFS transporter, OFA family, oxalate/formate antiporter
MLNNRWFQLAASLTAMIMIANLQYAWTLFVEPIRDAKGWELSDVQAAFTFFVLFQTWVQPLDGWFIDRLGPRGFITAAGVLCGFGWAGMGYATSLPAFYVLYCAAGTGAAFVYSGCIGSALKWFKERRGLASGIMAAGFGGGTALFIPLISSHIKSSGYESTFLASGVIQGLVIVVAAQFLRHPPAETLTVAKSVATGGSQIGRRHFTTLEMLQTRQFYWLYAMFVLMATGGLLVTANQGPIARAWGYSRDLLALAATISPLANGTSRIFWGWVSDRLGRESTMVLSFTLQAVCLLLVVGAGQTSGGWFVLSLALVYFTWGQIYSLFPATSGDYFGSRHATSNYAVLYTAKGVAAIGGGWIAARVYEMFGSWAFCFSGSGLMAIVAAVMAFRLRASAAALKAADLRTAMPAG